MICTAPVSPKCDKEAKFELRSLKEGTYLGHNCEDHVPKLTAKDYRITEVVNG